MKKENLNLEYHWLPNEDYNALKIALTSDNCDYIGLIQPFSRYVLHNISVARFKGVLSKRLINHLVCYYVGGNDLLHFHIYDYNKFICFSNTYDKTLDIYYQDKDFVEKYDKLIRKTILTKYYVK